MNNTSHSNDVVTQWRTSADSSNPAGPLFTSGAFAEADIVSETNVRTVGGCGTACTGSRTRYCC
jgi:Family of unknown function (DUF6229)